MLNSMSGSSYSNAMNNYLQYKYIDRFQIPNSSTAAPGSYSKEQWQKILEYNNAYSQLSKSNHDLYLSAIALKKVQPGIGKLSLTVNSSNADIGVKLLGEAIAGSFDVNVKQLAKAMQVKSDVFLDSTSALNLSGSFVLNNQTFSVSNTMSLTDIMNLINSGSAGVTASISDNQLVITSNTIGEDGAFTMNDNIVYTPGETTTTSSSSSSDPTVANISTLLSDTTWSHSVEVIQLASNSSSGGYSDTSSFQNPSDFGVYGTGGAYINSANDELDGGGLRGTSMFLKSVPVSSGPLTVSASMYDELIDNGTMGLYLGYKDANNYTSVTVDQNLGTLTLTKMVAGVKTTKQAFFSYDTVDFTHDLSISTDGNGNITATLQGGSMDPVTVSATGWNDAVIGSQVGGQIYNSYASGSDNAKRFSNFQIYTTQPTQQDAIYKIDGVQYTSSTNQVTVGDGTIDHATIDLLKIGTSTISNTVTTTTTDPVAQPGVLSSIGVLNTDSSFKHITQSAQDAIYSINNGTDIYSNTNSAVYNGVEMTFLNAGVATITVSASNTGSGSNKPNVNDLGKMIANYNVLISSFEAFKNYIKPTAQKAFESVVARNKSTLSSMGITRDLNHLLLIDSFKYNNSATDPSVFIDSILSTSLTMMQSLKNFFNPQVGS